MRINKKLVSIFSFMIIWILLTILAVTWGFEFVWPDNVHVNYGFPLVWATHTLSTFVGPVDIWEINLSILIIDLLLWLGTMVVAVAFVLYIFRNYLST